MVIYCYIIIIGFVLFLTYDFYKEWLYKIYQFLKPRVKPEVNPQVKPDVNPQVKPEGICFFDIDETLTTAVGDPDEIMQVCLDNNFLVGIVTASERRIENLCDTNYNPKEPWVAKLLCKQFMKSKKLYNSEYPIINGYNLNDAEFPRDYPTGVSFGFKKGYAMKKCIEDGYDYIPSNKIILFDDSREFIRDVKNSFPYTVVCSGRDCGGDKRLTKELVHSVIKSVR